MAVKKVKLSKPSKLSKVLKYRIRFDFGKKQFGLYGKKRKPVVQEFFKNHDDALAYYNANFS